MLYAENEQKQIEKVYEVFGEYIQKSPYIEWKWSEKLGYIFMRINIQYRKIEEAIVIECGEELCELLLYEISSDVLLLTENEHSEKEADPLERQEIVRRWEPYIQQLPEYQYLCNKILCNKE